MITMRKLVRKSASKISNGRYGEREPHLEVGHRDQSQIRRRRDVKGRKAVIQPCWGARLRRGLEKPLAEHFHSKFAINGILP